MKKTLAALVVSVVAICPLTACSQADSKNGATPGSEMKIFLVRHGKTMLNSTDRVQGWSDAPLTPDGEKVVHAAGRGLSDVKFQTAYSSDSGRAVQTTSIILHESKASKGLSPTTDWRLREFNFGTWEGDLNHTMYQAIADDQHVTLDDFLANTTTEGFANSVARLDSARPGADKNWPAEDYRTVTTRLAAGLNDIVKKETTKGTGNVLVVSHGLSISALLETMVPGFKTPASGLKNASVSILKYQDGKFSIESVNDLSYAEKGQK